MIKKRVSNHTIQCFIQANKENLLAHITKKWQMYYTLIYKWKSSDVNGNTCKLN